MLTVEENNRMTRVNKGSPMGDLLRQYWHPVAAVSELETTRTKVVRLLGEELVLYRDLSNTYGLLERHCPHRRADLSYGYVEDCGLRCSYHGWQFDERGKCIAQPFEEATGTSRFKESIHVRSYLVEERAGLLFAYLGSGPAPLVPNWEPFTFTDGFVQIIISEVPCNWLQCQENSIDPVHFEWLHANWSNVLQGRRESAPGHIKIEFEEFEFGFSYKRLLEGETKESRSWQWPRLCILPNLFQPINHFEWRVPIDDVNTLSIVWQYTRVPSDREPYVQERIPFWYAQIVDPSTGKYATGHVINQDTTAWVGQGEIADRENEHLGRSDEGVRLLRQQLEYDMCAVARGERPKGLIFDPQQNLCVALPGRHTLTKSLDRLEWWEDFAKFYRNSSGDYFSLFTGQPEHVRSEFEQAMGISSKDLAGFLAGNALPVGS